MVDRRAHARLFSLLVLGTLALHELRYTLAFGDHAHEAAATHSHAYLSLVVPLIGLAATLVLAALTLRSAAAGQRSARRARVARAWPLLSLGLLGLFAGQELLEGALTPGHPPGLDGVFGHGGWIAVPLAAALGAAIALSVRVVERLAFGRRQVVSFAPRLTVCDERRLTPGMPVAKPAAAPLAAHLAGRAPPTRG